MLFMCFILVKYFLNILWIICYKYEDVMYMLEEIYIWYVIDMFIIC